MALGQKDYRKLNRFSDLLTGLNDARFRNQQASLSKLVDEQDKENAAKVAEEFYRFAEGAPAQDVKIPSVKSKDIGFGMSIPTGVSETNVTLPKIGRTADEMLTAMAKAQSGLAKTGGRHSQETAKRIIDYIDAKVKLQPKEQQPRNRQTYKTDILNEGGTGLRIFKENGLLLKGTELRDMETGERLGVTFGKLDDTTPNTVGGGLNDTDPVFETLSNGYVQLRRNADGNFRPMTASRQVQLRNQLQDNKRSMERDLRSYKKDVEDYDEKIAEAKFRRDSVFTKDKAEVNKEIVELENKKGEAQDLVDKQADEIEKTITNPLKDLDQYEKGAPKSGPSANKEKGEGF